MATSAELDEVEALLMQRLRDTSGGTSWIVAGGVAQGLDAAVRALLELGAPKAIGLATRIGVGDVADDVRFIISDDARVGDDVSMVARIHDTNRELHNLPPWVRAQVDEWDPEHVAQAIVEFTIDAGLIAGRPTFGARRSEWAALEDKITIRDVWARAGVTTAPDQVVDTADQAQLIAAHDELATGQGTVWAVDNDQGWHGGGHGTHWVANRDDANRVAELVAAEHRRVRIQPFLEGVPCSIHGMVLADATLAFRPCEMLVLLDPEARKFVYSRAATFWDPEDTDRESMRATARAIGDELRATVDYRGVFTVDGVLTNDGFFPTEVNPRFGAALPPRLPTARGEELPLFFTHLLATEGMLDDLDAAGLEALLVERLDENRSGTAFIPTPAPPSGGEQQIALAGRWSGDRFVDLAAVAPDAATSNAPFLTASWGANPGGGLIFATFTDQMPTGPAVAPTLVEVRRFLDQHWALGLTELQTAFVG